MKVKVLKFNNYIKPIRKHYNDAGMDVFAAKSMLIEPGGTGKIPLGFGLCIPDGFMGLILPRSSYASMGIFTQASPIDSGYRGEAHAITTNTSKINLEVNIGDRLGQLVIIPITLIELTEESLESRGSKGFGSTGNGLESTGLAKID